jgi:hypothetical protein
MVGDSAGITTDVISCYRDEMGHVIRDQVFA